MEKNEKPKFKAYKVNEYQEVDSINFPKEIHIAYAVCAKHCGNREYIVDGQSQVCQYCGRLMFRTEVEKYVLK
ncbi:MAG: hypothetical protein GY729_05755 [Desulfobacteraceae bacterium]|nr:hypothetical protein [Desulfobacteraceae bacterium]